ncbi:MAG TPA: hypothetical protein VD866_00885 [Urbifossiella sp.]|nr:hypothetical protein [Urbifossiella sp.]
MRCNVSDARRKRKKFFIAEFHRQLRRHRVARELGQEAYTLLSLIATAGDEIDYARPVRYFNETLAEQLGCKSERALARVREKVVKAGWLRYEPGRKGVQGEYEIMVPGEVVAADAESRVHDAADRRVQDASECADGHDVTPTETAGQTVGGATDSLAVTPTETAGQTDTLLPITHTPHDARATATVDDAATRSTSGDEEPCRGEAEQPWPGGWADPAAPNYDPLRALKYHEKRFIEMWNACGLMPYTQRSLGNRLASMLLKLLENRDWANALPEALRVLGCLAFYAKPNSGRDNGPIDPAFFLRDDSLLYEALARRDRDPSLNEASQQANYSTPGELRDRAAERHEPKRLAPRRATPHIPEGAVANA